jgi:hypothetical protein
MKDRSLTKANHVETRLFFAPSVDVWYIWRWWELEQPFQWQSDAERSPFRIKTNWKQHAKSRQVCFTFEGWGKFRGGTWSDKTSSKVMPYHVINRTVHCRLDWHTHTARSPASNKGLETTREITA